MSSRTIRRADDGGLLTSTMVCKNCPKYMYSFETVKEAWVQDCHNKGRYNYERIKYYFKFTFGRHLKDIVFVIAYGVDHNAGIFLDFKAHKFLKEKVGKAVEIDDELTEVSPVVLSRKIPQIMRIFTSLNDFNLFGEQLRNKNHAIARQRYINGVYFLERISEVMEQKEALFLAFNAKTSEEDPKQVLQIGCVVFSLESQHFEEKYHFYHVKANQLSSLNDNILKADDHDDFDYPFESTEVSSLAEVWKKLQEDISRVDFLVTHSMSSESMRNFLRTQGLNAESKDTIDTLSIHSALFQESTKENSMGEILRKLDIPFENDKLLNAGCNAVYITKMFQALLSQ